jgi:GTP-binding protein
MFVDEVEVKLRSGNGGNGCLSFRREKFIPKGGPDGGDGGKGGDVIVICDHNVGDLVDYHYKGHFEAQDGEHGKGSQCTGKSGNDCTLKVPPGTIIYNAETNRRVAELLETDQQVILLKGGRGGLGNMNYKSATNQAPRKRTLGEPAESGLFRLELKTMAEVGLVGFPNAGKSTLVNMLTASKRKTAPYPFTTINPSVGVIEYHDTYERISLADIPGLIEGAHENKGLGHKFLRHIERCKVLLLIIDMAGEDGRDPLKDYEALLKELELYDPKLLKKTTFVAANKMDEPAAVDNLKRFKKKFAKADICPISCLSEEGLPALKEHIYELVQRESAKDL